MCLVACSNYKYLRDFFVIFIYKYWRPENLHALFINIWLFTAIFYKFYKKISGSYGNMRPSVLDRRPFRKSPVADGSGTAILGLFGIPRSGGDLLSARWPIAIGPAGDQGSIEEGQILDQGGGHVSGSASRATVSEIPAADGSRTAILGLFGIPGSGGDLLSAR